MVFTKTESSVFTFMMYLNFQLENEIHPLKASLRGFFTRKVLPIFKIFFNFRTSIFLFYGFAPQVDVF